MSECLWEDHLLERKTESDLKDLFKTMVAFANSVRPGHIAQILIGERNDGTAQGVTNADNIQKKVREVADKIYPPMVWKQQLYDRDGETCVRVEIEYSGETPHFGSPAWVRKGSETIEATESVFQQLIENRLSKVRQLRLWVGQEVQLAAWDAYQGRLTTLHLKRGVLEAANNFYVTLAFGDSDKRSESIENITLSWDHDYDCPKIEYKPFHN